MEAEKKKATRKGEEKGYEGQIQLQQLKIRHLEKDDKCDLCIKENEEFIIE